MPCDTRARQGQSLSERKAEVKKAISALEAALAARRARVVIGPQGAVAFDGWAERDSARVTDACAYRTIMVSGSALAKAAIARAEQLAGRSVDKQVIGQGTHSHNGGRTWHDHK